jgi:hypothetical protein
MSETHDRRPRGRYVVNLLSGATDEEVADFLGEQFDPRSLRPEPGPYPCVVTRHFPAVYSSKRVSWTHPGEAGNAVIPCAEPFGEDGELRDEARGLVVAYALERAAATGFKHCAVFGARDAVYVEPDGTTSDSTEPPRWGRTVTRYADVH